MIDCARCGTPNPEGSRFCNSCGASLVSRVSVQERRVVTALFADLARSTSMGERLDPEVVRGLVGQFFELATREIEARGGTVEKFSGDAVMAVFGIPQAHEDDPERAVRAALAIRDGLRAISDDASARHGITVQARVGVEAGEVVVGDPFGGATMATGDAMNLAARLEQQAEPSEVVIGEAVYDHVRHHVVAEPLGELNLKGHDAPLNGWRVTEIAAEVGRPRGVPGLEAPLTGRDEELNLLLDAGRRAKQGNKSSLFTIFGVPGVGKSRLTREATARLEQDGWTITSGRCLPYGDGITYWPVAEIVRKMAGILPQTSQTEARSKLKTVSPDESVVDNLAVVIGAGDRSDISTGAVSSDREIAYAFRSLVEHLGRTRGPQVLIFEDIHWAEPPLLDLIEYLVTWTRDAPLLVICPSRPELVDMRPSWGSGRMDASRISLEPLSEAESRSLLAALLTVDDLPASLRQKVLDQAEGNPLYVEEVVRMLIEEGVVERRGDHWYAKAEAADVRVPDSVEALIRARLDTLPVLERRVLQAASVVGRTFQQSAVVAIAPPDKEDRIETHLEDAVLRDLITDERAPTEPTYRFRHILIRDVAYATLPKAHRADLHLAVADWLRAWADGRIDEFVEIEAYHLEEAVKLRLELTGRVDPAENERAVAALTASAQKAAARDDSRVALAFAERALALDPANTEQRLEAEILQLESWRYLGQWRLAGDMVLKVESDARALKRPDIEGRAVFAQASNSWIGLEIADAEKALTELERARKLLIEAGNDWYLVRVLEFVGYGPWWFGDLRAAEKVWTEMRDIAHSNGWFSKEAEATTLIARVRGQIGDRAGQRQLLEDAMQLAERGSSRLTRARVRRVYGTIVGSCDSEEAGVEIMREVTVEVEQLSDKAELFAATSFLGDILARSDRWTEALPYYEQALAAVREHSGYRTEAMRRMAHAKMELGDVEEAARIAEEAVATTAMDDTATVGSTLMVRGRVREAQGRLEEAEADLREAVAVISKTDYQGSEENLALAEFLLRQGRADEAAVPEAIAMAAGESFGTDSPMLRFIKRRIAEAAEVGAAKGARDDR